MTNNASFSMDNAKVTATLAAANASHLKFLEEWATKTPAAILHGVNILQCMNYETIQVLNNEFLGVFLKEQELSSQPEQPEQSESSVE